MSRSRSPWRMDFGDGEHFHPECGAWKFSLDGRDRSLEVGVGGGGITGEHYRSGHMSGELRRAF